MSQNMAKSSKANNAIAEAPKPAFTAILFIARLYCGGAEVLDQAERPLAPNCGREAFR
jgi:hypothetical protein